MNYKLTAITFKTINEAISFIDQENHKWVEVGGHSYQIINNINTTVVTVVFAKAIVYSALVRGFMKIVKGKTRIKCLELLFKTYFPKVTTSEHLREVPTAPLRLKDFLHSKLNDLIHKIPNGKDRYSWDAEILTVKASLDRTGVSFWRAATAAIEWLQKQNQLQSV
jgi:hypothetical protein